jgi:hypothetical protein
LYRIGADPWAPVTPYSSGKQPKQKPSRTDAHLLGTEAAAGPNLFEPALSTSRSPLTAQTAKAQPLTQPDDLMR